MELAEQYKDVLLVLQACVNSKKNGIALDSVNEEFKSFYGSDIPFAQFGYPTLKSYLSSLPNIYVVKDEKSEKQKVIFASDRSQHITQLVNSNKRDRCCFNRSWASSDSSNVSINNEEFYKLQAMLPLFYNHQALGDDFLLDIADTKFGYYVPPNGPFQCGLCACNQTINELIDNVHNARYLAPKAVVMIGIVDILQGRNMRDILYDLRRLLYLLKFRNVNITLITAIKPAFLSFNANLERRIRAFNKAILKFARDPFLKCNVIDMYSVFRRQLKHLRYRDYPSNNVYQIFTKQGKKLFSQTLRTYLRN